ncbi:MAG: dihydrofolate reductase family protein [Anaerolineaceae bacterium]
MRKIIVFNHVTLDGFFAGPNGELDWPVKDDGESTEFAREGQGEADTFIFGRVTYEMMAGYWPTPAAIAQNPVFANALNNNAKIVFSKTLTKTGWANTQLWHEINREEILKLKALPGKNMLIFGSGTIVQQLTALGLIDEYQLILNPLVLGKGKPLFLTTAGAGWVWSW